MVPGPVPASEGARSARRRLGCCAMGLRTRALDWAATLLLLLVAAEGTVPRLTLPYGG